MGKAFRRALGLSHTRQEADLDAPEMIDIHRDILSAKPFLRNIYEEHYLFFRQQAADLPPGLRVEIGSGAGFLKGIMPDAITTDIVAHPTIDICCDAQAMPFADDSVSAFFLQDTFHHVQDVERFLREADRCLVEGGKMILVEPANTAWARFIYTQFHHEPFEPEEKEWRLPLGGRMSMANGALPWMVFERDREKFRELFPALQIASIDHIQPLRFLLSGGFSMRQLVPASSYDLVKAFEERLLAPWSDRLGMFMRIVLEKSTPASREGTPYRQAYA